MRHRGEDGPLGRGPGHFLVGDDGHRAWTHHQRAQREAGMTEVDGLAGPGRHRLIGSHHQQGGRAVEACPEAGQVDGPAPALVRVAGQLDLHHDGEHRAAIEEEDDEVRVVLGRDHLGQLGRVHPGLGEGRERNAQHFPEQLGGEHGAVLEEQQQALVEHRRRHRRTLTCVLDRRQRPKRFRAARPLRG